MNLSHYTTSTQPEAARLAARATPYDGAHASGMRAYGKTVCTGMELDHMARRALAAYRYSVFIERLGWQLPAAAGWEEDAYDRPDTVYAFLRDERERICGCARLLPTLSPYLLEEVFPHLLDGMTMPRSATVWELSRFSSASPVGAHGQPGASGDVTAPLLAAALEAASVRGAERVVTVSPIGILRLLKRMGVTAMPIGSTQRVDGAPVAALCIDIDDTTRTALGLPCRPAREARLHYVGQRSQTFAQRATQ
jgi:N-acyl-L-homoserine lactone synthetase